MPKVGIEPTLPREHDFESCASASSATSASAKSIGYALTSVNQTGSKSAGPICVAIKALWILLRHLLTVMFESS